MGLDMYLSAKRHLSNYDFEPKESALNASIRDAIGLSSWNSETASVDVSVTIGYWRKANQIHSWFVKHIQGGEDNCREHWVSRTDLMRLRDTCKESLEKRDPSLLPPQSGFFFGPTDVDEYYWEDIEFTQNLLDRALSDQGLIGCEFYYQSSW
jgi:hypothetical protein